MYGSHPCMFDCIQLRQEKVQLEKTLEQEQEQQISKLTRKIDRLEKDVRNKQFSLDQVSSVSSYLLHLQLSPPLCSFVVRRLTLRTL